MHKFNLDLTTNTECQQCLDILISGINKNFDFIEYSAASKTFTFEDETKQSDVQEYIDNFNCVNGKQEISLDTNYDVTAIKKNSDPTIKSNLEINILWLNNITGEMFVCTDSTPDLNIWVGTKTDRIIRPTPPANKFDILEDGSSLGFWPFDKKTTNDMGGKYHGKSSGIRYGRGLSDGWHLKSSTVSTVKINMPMSSLDAITVMMWVKWNGNNSTMPVGFQSYDIYMYNGTFGFNTGRGDCNGIDFKKYKHKWVYTTVVFKQGELGKIYLNGQHQSLTSNRGNFSSASAKLTDTLSVFGWGSSSGYRHFGNLDRLRVFNRELTANEIQSIWDSENKYIKGTS